MRNLLIILSGIVMAVIFGAQFGTEAEAQKMSPPDYAFSISCANVRCASGTYCADRPGGPVCEPITSRPTCASTLCQVGNQCVETSTGPQCVPNRPSYPAQPTQPSYPTYPSYNYGQSCAYGGYYQYGRLICYPPPAWRHPYQYGWGQYYRPQPVPVPRPQPRPRPPWNPWGREHVKPAPDPGVCTMEYDPVCGEKPVVCVRSPCPPLRKTFGNACSAKNDGYTVLYKGVCN